MITYAGVNLPLATQEVKDWVQAFIPLRSIWTPWQNLPWPEGYIKPNYDDMPPVSLGTLYMPAGAARWTHGYFLATGDMLPTIAAATLDDDNLPKAATFVMGSSDRQISLQLFTLPPIPLSMDGIKEGVTTAAEDALNFQARENDLYLLPLYDERFTWWGSITSTFSRTVPIRGVI